MQKKRKKWFEFVKSIMRIFIKKTEFVYLDKKIDERSIVISNHEGTKAPLAWELYNDIPVRFWGAYEMNSGLKKMYEYQSEVYYHEKHHWCMFGAKAFCLIASPLTNMFYKGLDLISTYKDSRFKKTIKESVDALNNGDNVVLFPEVSEKGYLPELEGLHGGFLLLAEVCLKRGMDVPIYPSYYRKNQKRYIVGKPVLISKLYEGGKTREQILIELCLEINRLGKLTDEEIEKEKELLG